MKKTTIKILAIILSLVATFTFFGCSGAVTAYEIAVENGFEGTEQEWLDSLKGENGLNGKDGENAKISIEEIYSAAVKNGFEGSFLEFIDQYLDDNTNTSSIESVINSSLFSVVDVISEFQVVENNALETGYSSGAGVFYSVDKQAGDALIITNFHVIYNASAYGTSKFARRVQIGLYGMEFNQYLVDATIIGGSMTYDIAILKVENSSVIKNSNAKAVTFADSTNLKVGSTAIAIGNADGDGIAATTGVVSVDSEYIQMYASDEVTLLEFRSVRFDAAVNPGNSGGGLFNAKGELIGIVNAKTISNEVENMSYAIPSSLAKAVAENLIYNSQFTNGIATVSKGLMGVTVVSAESKAIWNEELQMAQIVETIKVEDVSNGALVAGIMQKGDQFVSLTHNGKTVLATRMFVIVDYMLNVRPGDSITIEYIRNGETKKATLVVGSEHFSTIV